MAKYRKRIIIMIAVVFFSIMGILTIFSQWFMEQSLPKVQIYTLTSGMIEETHYDFIVPLSSLGFGEKGAVIWAVESRETPMGNRYMLRGYNVEILAQNEYMAAVSGALTHGLSIVASDVSDFSEGTQVRLD